MSGWLCCTRYKKHTPSSGIITRKALKRLTSSSLGSFYDAVLDRIVFNRSVRGTVDPSFSNRSTLKLFQGDASKDAFDYLGSLHFDKEILQSLRFRLTVPFGVSGVIEDNQIIDHSVCLLYYSYKDREERLLIDPGKANAIVRAPPLSTEATHMITRAVLGFEILCIISIPDGQLLSTLDQCLIDIFDKLEERSNEWQLDDTLTHQIDQINVLAMFGTYLCVHPPKRTLLEVVNSIRTWTMDKACHQPIEYTMESLRWLYNSRHYPEFSQSSEQIPQTVIVAHECLMRNDKWVKACQRLFESLPPSITSPFLNTEKVKFQRQYDTLLRTLQHFRHCYGRILAESRRRNETRSTVTTSSTAPDLQPAALNEPAMNSFYNQLVEVSDKIEWIRTLGDDDIKYLHVFDFCPGARNLLTMEDFCIELRRWLVKEDQDFLCWYSSDQLKHDYADRWEKTKDEILRQRSQTSTRITVVYIDFSQSFCHLQDFVIESVPAENSSPTTSDNHRGNQIDSAKCQDSPPIRTQPGSRKRGKSEDHSNSNQASENNVDSASISTSQKLMPRPETTNGHSDPEDQPKIQLPKNQDQSPGASTEPKDLSRSEPPSRIPPKTTFESRDAINILLLGASGVGKSTFINALVNYLAFDSLDEAENKEPIVLIPVSFLTTVGDDFEEKTVHFGDPDSNENFNKVGQSVTQQCRSYIIPIEDEKDLCLIDTPGLGDTRGIDQDVKNIDYILTYLNNFSYLDAICILLKPNVSRMDISFRSCLQRLFTDLVPLGAQSNIMFCFTNTRTTFYAPGDSGPIVRQLLQKENLHQLFKKDNIFCFDSESFRYLAAIRSGVGIDTPRDEYVKSWNQSVAESVRLIESTAHRSRFLINRWQSLKKSIIELDMIARPVMEKLRVLIFNMKLIDSRFKNYQVEIKSQILNDQLCTHCAQMETVPVGPLKIVQYKSDKQAGIGPCQCPYDENHFLIESCVTYEYSSTGNSLSVDDYRQEMENLLKQCHQLVYSIRQHTSRDYHGPFTRVLQRFYKDQKTICCDIQNESDVNRKILDKLKPIVKEFDKNSEMATNQNEELSPPQIYELIKKLKSIADIKTQVEDIEQSRRQQMENSQHRIPTDAIKNINFLLQVTQF